MAYIASNPRQQTNLHEYERKVFTLANAGIGDYEREHNRGASKGVTKDIVDMFLHDYQNRYKISNLERDLVREKILKMYDIR